MGVGTRRAGAVAAAVLVVVLALVFVVWGAAWAVSLVVAIIELDGWRAVYSVLMTTGLLTIGIGSLVKLRQAYVGEI